jgi:hypothetical protein
MLHARDKGVTPTPPPTQTWRGASPLKSNRPHGPSTFTPSPTFSRFASPLV